MAKLLFALLLCAAVWWVVRPRRRRPRDLGVAEARAVLGLDADADAHAIRLAHRRLVQAVHPDRGGSADLTRRINLARDTLLRAAAADPQRGA